MSREEKKPAGRTNRNILEHMNREEKKQTVSFQSSNKESIIRRSLTRLSTSDLSRP